MDALSILKIITLFLLSIIMMVFIVIEIKAIFFIKDVNKSLDEILNYLRSVSWMFNIIDLITEKINNLKDKLTYFISILFKR